MTSEDAELLQDNKDTVRVLFKLAAEHCDAMALRMGSVDYKDGGQALVLARAELEGARKLLTGLRSKVLSK